MKVADRPLLRVQGSAAVTNQCEWLLVLIQPAKIRCSSAAQLVCQVFKFMFSQFSMLS